MGIFSKVGANVLDKTISTIDKAVTDKDLKNQLIKETTLAHINNTMNARENTNGVAKWVRAGLAIGSIALYIGVNVAFMKFVMALDASLEIKVTFFYKMVSDVVMILMVVLGFYFGSSDKTSDNLEDIRKTVGKIK